MGSHIVTTARGDSPYVGIPVFLSRAFRHSAIYVRTDRGIRTAADLAGRTIGLPEYQQTAALWVRGILREHYGVDTRGIAWRTGGERVAITLPAGLRRAAARPRPGSGAGERRDRRADRAAPAGLPRVAARRSRGSIPTTGRRRWPGTRPAASSRSCIASRSARTSPRRIPGCRWNCTAPSARPRRCRWRSCSWSTCCASRCPGSPRPMRSRRRRWAAIPGPMASPATARRSRR